MSIEVGVNGVVKTMKTPSVAVSGVIKTPTFGHVGVSGAVKQVFPPKEVNYIEVRMTQATVYNIDSSYNILSTVGNGMSYVNSHGSVTTTNQTSNNYIQVTNTVSGTETVIYGNLYIVYNDGSKVLLAKSLLTGSNDKFSIGYYIYFSGNGCYINYALGKEICSGHVNGSTSGTTTVAQSEILSSGFEIGAGKTQSGTTHCRQTYYSAVINGKTITNFKIVNNIPS